MQNQVKIAPDELGNVIRVSKNNSDYGHVRITYNSVGFSASGWVNPVNLSALIHGKVEDLNDIGIAKMETLPGKIYVREQFEAFSEVDPNRDLKIAGDTGVVCVGTDTDTGEIDCPIYRKTFYDQTGTVSDILIPHTNSDSIKKANATKSAADGADVSQNNVTITDEALANIKKGIDEEETVEETQEETIVNEEETIVDEEESFEL